MKVSEVIQNFSHHRNIEGIMRLMQVVLDNLITSNYGQDDELSAILLQITDLTASFKQTQLHQLRLKAVIDRGERYANTFTQQIIDTFQDNVITLGEAISIDRHSLTVFSESFVRFHLIFQLSKCFDYLSEWVRQSLKLPPYVVISPNKATGRVFHVKKIYDCLKINHNNEDMILLVDEADGTEEIPSTLVQAVVLGHDLPQLSHLAIRAR